MKTMNNDEYMMLRDEIIKRIDSQNNLSTFIITSVITLFGIGFALDHVISYFFLLPFMILLPMSAKQNKDGRHISYMVSYMIVFFESTHDFAIQWESNTYLLRISTNDEISNSLSNKIIRFISTFEFALLSLVSYTLFLCFYFKYEFDPYILTKDIMGLFCVGLFIILTFLVFIITCKYNEYGKNQAYFIEKWLKYSFSQKLISEEEYNNKVKKFLS
jgi:hypothetical protein